MRLVPRFSLRSDTFPFRPSSGGFGGQYITETVP